MEMDGEEKRSSTSGFRSLPQHNRSKSILLSSESISGECVAITTYQRLSQSARFSDQRQHKRRGWLFLSRFIFRHQKQDDGGGGGDTGGAEKDEKTRSKEKSRWSSWLPDPNRRWPVQGW